MADIKTIELEREEILKDIRNLFEKEKKEYKDLEEIFKRFILILKNLEEVFEGKDDFIRATRKAQFRTAEIQAEIHREIEKKMEFSLSIATSYIRSLKEGMSKDFLGVHIWKEFQILKKEYEDSLKEEDKIIDEKYDLLKDITEKYLKEIFKNIEELKEIKIGNIDIGKNLDILKRNYKATEKPLKELKGYIDKKNEEAVERGFTWLSTADAEIMKALRDNILKPVTDFLKEKTTTIKDYAMIMGEKAYVGRAVITSKGGIFFNYINSIDKFLDSMDEILKIKIRDIEKDLEKKQKESLKKFVRKEGNKIIGEAFEVFKKLKDKRNELRKFEDFVKNKKENLFKDMEKFTKDMVKDFEKTYPGFEFEAIKSAISEKADFGKIKNTRKMTESFFNNLRKIISEKNIEKLVKSMDAYSAKSLEDMKNEAEIYEKLFDYLGFFVMKRTKFLDLTKDMTKYFAAIFAAKLMASGVKINFEEFRNLLLRKDVNTKDIYDSIKKSREAINKQSKSLSETRRRGIEFMSVSFMTNLLEVMSACQKLEEEYKGRTGEWIKSDYSDGELRDIAKEEMKKFKEIKKSFEERVKNDDADGAVEKYKELATLLESDFFKKKLEMYEMLCRHLKLLARRFKHAVEDTVRITKIEKEAERIERKSKDEVKSRFLNVYKKLESLNKDVHANELREANTPAKLIVFSNKYDINKKVKEIFDNVEKAYGALKDKSGFLIPEAKVYAGREKKLEIYGTDGKSKKTISKDEEIEDWYNNGLRWVSAGREYIKRYWEEYSKYTASSLISAVQTAYIKGFDELTPKEKALDIFARILDLDFKIVEIRKKRISLKKDIEKAESDLAKAKLEDKPKIESKIARIKEERKKHAAERDSIYAKQASLLEEGRRYYQQMEKDIIESFNQAHDLAKSTKEDPGAAKNALKKAKEKFYKKSKELQKMKELIKNIQKITKDYKDKHLLVFISRYLEQYAKEMEYKGKKISYNPKNESDVKRAVDSLALGDATKRNLHTSINKACDSLRKVLKNFFVYYDQTFNALRNYYFVFGEQVFKE